MTFMTPGTLASAYPLGTDILLQFGVRIGTSLLIGRINNDIRHHSDSIFLTYLARERLFQS